MMGGMDWYKSFKATITGRQALLGKNLGGQIPLGFGRWIFKI